jgi:hypothetical protein
LVIAAEQNLARGTYSTKIIKAGALLTDTRTFFSYWDPALSPAENLERLRAGNVLAKGSRSRVEDVLAILRQRYLGEPGVVEALVTLVQGGASASLLTPIFYFHAAQNDAVLHDVVTELLVDLQWQGRAEVTTEQIVMFLAERARDGRVTLPWSEPTTRRVAHGVLSALRDFGVLSGGMKTSGKQLAPMYLPIEAFAYVAFLLSRRLRSGDRLVSSDEWRLFFLSSQLVERFFVEADMQRLLTFNAAGRVVRVDFPVDSIEEYGRALAQRAR